MTGLVLGMSLVNSTTCRVFWLGRIVVKFAIRKTFIFKVNETVTLESPLIILSSFFGELFPNVFSFKERL